MYAAQFDKITGLLTEIRDRLPERAPAAPDLSATVDNVMTDAMRLEKVRMLAMAWVRSSNPLLVSAGKDVLHVVGGE